MQTGDLNRTAIIQTQTESVSGGNVTYSWDAGTSIRVKVTMIDGSIYINDAELIGKTLYKFQFWDNSYKQTIRLIYDGMVLYPVKPLLKNPGDSFLTEVTVLTATKSGEVDNPIIYDDHIYTLYDTTLLADSSYLDIM